ncbi:serine hydrolase [Nocardia pseudobrasiliensis]|nr:serine hydrolase [Nocardia pseudobrasiliensis]
MSTRVRRILIPATLTVVVLTVGGCGGGTVRRHDIVGPMAPQRLAKVTEYLGTRPGFAGVVLRDRVTGAVWRTEHSSTLMWGCSVPKLAMAVDLLLREDAGAVRLSDEDRALVHAMLHSSDNDAADALWNRFGGAAEFGARFPSYGMTDMRFSDEHEHTWGWILTTADDFDRLVNHVLEGLPATIRDYLIDEMRSVGPEQRWGVWGAGSEARPGLKNGWSDDDDDGSWLTHSAGFAGPDARYTLAITDNTKLVENGYETGAETTTTVARLLFDPDS